MPSVLVLYTHHHHQSNHTIANANNMQHTRPKSKECLTRAIAAMVPLCERAPYIGIYTMMPRMVCIHVYIYIYSFIDQNMMMYYIIILYTSEPYHSQLELELANVFETICNIPFKLTLIYPGFMWMN